MKRIPQRQARFIENGVLNDFMLFTTAGAVSATGITIMPNTKAMSIVGSHDSAPTGFNPAIFTTITGNSKTSAAVLRLPLIVSRLLGLATTNAIHAPAFSNAEIIIPAIYEITGAASFAGTVYFDGLGESNSIFVFKIGGALAIAADVHMVCINKALPSNIYFLITGAFTAGAGSDVVGNFLCNPGAGSIGATCTLNGRLLTTAGAVTIGAGCTLKSS